jgi:hypothetical protein
MAAADRVAGPVDSARTVTLRGHVRPEAQPQFDQGPVDPGQELSHVSMFFNPAPGLEAFLAEQQTPGAPDYHRWLKPEEFAGRFGVSEHDIAALTGWLESQGLRVDDVARGRHWIAFSGSARSMSRAFHTPIHRFRVAGAGHFANTSVPSIPQAFENVVSGIAGLDDFGPQSMIVPAGPAYNSSTSHQLAPDDLATIFDIKKLYQAGIDGSGQTIAIAGQTDFDLSDIQAFRRRFGLPSNDPRKVIYGTNPGKNSDLIEADLDLEWAGAIAPEATVIFALSQEVFLSAQYAIDQNLAPILSMSYAGCEPYYSAGFMRGVWQQANAQGITLLAASGDAGAATCERFGPTPQATKGPTVSWPASVPEMTAVGGTALNDASGGPYWAVLNDGNLGSALGYIPEIAWNDSAARNGLDATGGGPSALFAKPYWQTGPGVPNDGARDVPDISLPASPSRYPYMITTAGVNTAVGGTSASSPSLAGILALLNQYLVAQHLLSQPGLGNINPALYRLAQATTDVFHAVTGGDNKLACEQGSPQCVNGLMGFSAGPGYDMTTGLGSVDAYKLVTEWNAGTASATAMTASPSSGVTSESYQLTATVQGASGSGPAPTGAVVFLANDAVLGSATLAASGAAATATLAVTGNALGAGVSAVSAYYPGDGVYTGSSGTATISIQLPAGGGSVVQAVVEPNPVVQSGIYWSFEVTLSERAGVATTLTGSTIGGTPVPLSLFTSPNIPAGGSVAAAVSLAGVAAPASYPLIFTGKDANGKTWSQQVVVSFVGPSSPPLEPAVDLIGAPTVAQVPGADPTCQFPVQLTVEESGGFLMQLTSLAVAGTSYTNAIQQTFGTTRLAPYGMVQGTLCLPGTVATGTKTVQLVSTSVDGTLHAGSDAHGCPRQPDGHDSGAGSGYDVRRRRVAECRLHGRDRARGGLAGMDGDGVAGELDVHLARGVAAFGRRPCHSADSGDGCGALERRLPRGDLDSIRGDDSGDHRHPGHIRGGSLGRHLDWRHRQQLFGRHGYRSRHAGGDLRDEPGAGHPDRHHPPAAPDPARGLGDGERDWRSVLLRFARATGCADSLRDRARAGGSGGEQQRAGSRVSVHRIDHRAGVVPVGDL